MVPVFLPTVQRTSRLRVAVPCQTVAESESEPWQLVPKPRFCSELVTNRASFFSNSTPARGTGDHFSRLGGRSLPPKRRVPVALGRCRAKAGALGGAGALSPDRWRPAHLFISEAALDWISRCLSPSEEQCAGAAERAAANPVVIDRSGAGPPAPAG